MITTIIGRFPGISAIWPQRRTGGQSPRTAKGPVTPGHIPTRFQRVRQEHLAAESVLRAHAAIVEFAYDALIGLTRKGEVRSWNHAAERVFGYTPAQAVGRHLSFLAAPGQIQEQADLMTNALAGRIAPPMETTRRRRDGTPVSVELSVMPIRNAAGAVVALAGSARDISARKRVDAHRALLADELTHRVKNTLATVQSIAVHSLRGAASLEDFEATFCARLRALSATHTLLTRGGWKGAALAELVDTELAPYLGGPARLMAAGPGLNLDPGKSLALGMMLHELATNAAKYGALSTPTGRVCVDWEILGPESAPRLKLVWRESGGPEVFPPTRRGFGTRLVTQGLAHELAGAIALSFPASGVTCEIDVPLPPAQA